MVTAVAHLVSDDFEPIEPPKMAKNILSYGALRNMCVQLENKITSLNLTNVYLKKECFIQKKVINQSQRGVCH